MNSELKGNLLLVDDEELILKKTKIILDEYADNIFTATGGKLALDILKQENIHCVVCDINMPEMNGIDVVKKVRELDLDMPFIFYTGHGSDSLMREAIKYGAYDFLDKPGLDGLEEVIQRGLADGVKSGSPAQDQKGLESDEFMSEYKKMLNSQKESP